MNSNNIYKENSDPIYYCYFIGWSNQNMYYYGRRTAKESNPKEFWVTYFTSSKHVKKFREEFGEPDIIQIRKTFKTVEECKYHESKVLKRLMASKRNDFLNKTNGDKNWDATGNEYFAKEYKIKTPEGDIVYIKNLTKFCEENDLIHSNMVAAASTTSKRKTIHHKLYQIRKINDDRPFLPVEDLQIDYYIIKLPTGEIIEREGLYQIAKELGIERSQLYPLVSGYPKHYKGIQIKKKGDQRPFYTDEELKESSKLEITDTEFEAINMKGEYFTIDNINEFCKLNKLKPNLVKKVILGIKQHCKGWQIKPKNSPREFIDISKLLLRIKKRYTFISPENEEYVAEHINTFAKEHGLDRGCMLNLVTKLQIQHRGWKLKSVEILE